MISLRILLRESSHLVHLVPRDLVRRFPVGCAVSVELVGLLEVGCFPQGPGGKGDVGTARSSLEDHGRKSWGGGRDEGGRERRVVGPGLQERVGGDVRGGSGGRVGGGDFCVAISGVVGVEFWRGDGGRGGRGGGGGDEVGGGRGVVKGEAGMRDLLNSPRRRRQRRRISSPLLSHERSRLVCFLPC